MKKTISIKLQFLLLGILTGGLFVVALGSTLWEMSRSQQKLVAYIDTELSAERHLRDLYAQGLQMGQAIRNILLDPANPKAYQNHDKAQQDFDAALDGLAALELEGEQGRKLLMDLRAGQAAWQPLRHGVIEAVRGGDVVAAREALVARETPAWRSVKQVMLDGLVAARQQTVDTRAALLEQLHGARLRALALGALALAVGLTMTLLMLRRLSAQLGGEPAYAVEVARRIAARQLDEPVRVDGDRADSVLGAMAVMQEQLSESLREVQRNAHVLGKAAGSLQGNAARVEQASQSQSESGTAIAAAVEQMTVSISQVADNAGEADRLAGDADRRVQESMRVIDEAGEAMRRIAGRIEASAEEMVELGRNTEAISGIVKVIEELAGQTNLLALNAAIEAARAGEQGRGFAVVADEVRKLAERTANSTQEIAAMVQRVQHSAQQAIDGMRDGETLVGEGVTHSGQAREAMGLLEASTAQVRDAVASIDLALREQRSASVEIARGVERIAAMSEETHTASLDSARRANDLEGLARGLGEMVARFRLGA